MEFQFALNDMNRDKEFIISYLALVICLTVIAACVLVYCTSVGFPAILFAIPVFFCIMLGVMWLLKRSCGKKKRDKAFFFMEYRIVKMLLSIVFLAACLIADREHMLPFAIVFVVFYFVMMTFETVHFIKGEKKS